MKEKLLADAFAACLDDIENKGATLEDCLARYPELRPELEEALRLVLDIRALPPWQVSPEFKATARQRIVRRIRNRQARPTLADRLSVLNPFSWPGQLGLAPVMVRVMAVLLAALVVVTGGTAIASSDTLPDNPLHQVKLATENLELLLQPAGEGKTTMLIELLDRRTSELLTMSWQDKVDGAQRAMVNYQAILQVGHKMLESYSPDNASQKAFAVQWQEALARNLAVMQGLVDAMPPRMQAGLQAVISDTQKEQSWVNGLLSKTPTTPDQTAVPTAPADGSASSNRCQYIVKKGDTLSAIARQYNTTWQRLAALNNLSSPDSIKIGQQLAVPCAAGAGDGQTPPAEFALCPYIVKSGDTLSAIARKYNTTTRLLLAVNNLPSADRILAGQKLSVPCYAK